MYGRPGLSNFLYFRIYRLHHTAFRLVRVLAAGRRERAENKIPRSRKWEQLRMSESDDVRRALRMRHAPRRRVAVGRHVKSARSSSSMLDSRAAPLESRAKPSVLGLVSHSLAASRRIRQFGFVALFRRSRRVAARIRRGPRRRQTTRRAASVGSPTCWRRRGATCKRP